jgi:hypothetical protein
MALALLASGCGASSAGRVAQRLPTRTPLSASGHVVTVPVNPNLTVTPLPTLKPGVPTPVLPTVAIPKPTWYVYPKSAYRARIYGSVTNAHTHSPISGAVISVAHGQHTATSDISGRYSIKVPVGASVTLQVSRSGYLAVPGITMLNDGQSKRVDFKLQPASQAGKGPPAFPVIIGKPH